MLATYLAGDPRATPDVLDVLAEHLLAGQRARSGLPDPGAQHRPPALLLGQLLRHPALRPAALIALVNQWPDALGTAADAGTLTPDLLTAAADVTSRSFLHVVGTTGSTALLQLAFDHAASAGVWSALLVNWYTPAHLSRAAALQLAAQPGDEFTHAILLRYLSTHPTERRAAGRAATTHRVRWAIRAQDAAAHLPRVPGRLAWFERTTTPATLTYLAAHPDVDTWRAALAAHPDPDGALHHGALLAHPRDVDLCQDIAASPIAAAENVQQALLVLHRAGQVQLDSDSAPRHLAGGPLTFATALAPYVRTHDQLRALLTRTDLDADVLAQLTQNLGRDQSPWAWHLSRLRRIPAWGAALATHPTATPAQRVCGMALACKPEPTGTQAQPAIAWSPQDQARTREIARAGQLVTTHGPAAAGRALPMSAFAATAPDMVLSTLGWLAVAAVGTYPDPATARTSTATLLRLAPTFPGTLGELVDTVASLVAPCHA